jgi:choline dehydrogenase-like flavoprotein
MKSWVRKIVNRFYSCRFSYSTFCSSGSPIFDSAGGCPLAQTLVEGGLKVLLVERGRGKRPNSSKSIVDTWNAIRSDCAEVIRSVDGISIISGNCLGGATSFNLGMYVEETPRWVVDHLGKGFGTEDEVADAFEWVRDRIGAAPTHENIGSGAEEYIRSSLQTFKDPGNFEIGNVSSSGSPRLQQGQVWRTYSIFDPVTGERNSADRILDLDNDKLEIRSNTKVVEILFDGDSGVPSIASGDKKETPRARCVKFESSEIQCVREGGRIYIAAGAVHTVELLLKSGIKRGGKVDNSQVRSLCSCGSRHLRR